MEDNDAQLHLKKRARRRLVGAVFFASVVAVVLPMVMDHEPRQTVQDVEIRIPGQNEKPFAPKFAAAPVDKAAEKPAEPPAVVEAKPPVEAPIKATARVLEVPKDGNAADKPSEKPVVKAEKAPEKAVVKPAAKAPEKAAEKPADKPKAPEGKPKPVPTESHFILRPRATRSSPPE